MYPCYCTVSYTLFQAVFLNSYFISRYKLQRFYIMFYSVCTNAQNIYFNGPQKSGNRLSRHLLQKPITQQVRKHDYWFGECLISNFFLPFLGIKEAKRGQKGGTWSYFVVFWRNQNIKYYSLVVVNYTNFHQDFIFKCDSYNCLSRL